MSNEFKELPHVIYVATPERVKNYQWAEGSKYISPNVCVYTKETVMQLQCEKPNRIQVGDVLVLHPFEEDMYVNVNEVQNIKNAKFFAYKRIAQQLGASRYEVTYANKQTSNRSFDTNNNVTCGSYVDACLSVNKKDDFLKSMGFEMEAKFTGNGEISEESYEKAKKLVKRYHLETDEGIKSLIESRNPKIENPETYEKVTCDLLSEISASLDLAFTLNAAGGLFSLDSKTSDVIKQSEIVKLTVQYTFPERKQ